MALASAVVAAAAIGCFVLPQQLRNHDEWLPVAPHVNSSACRAPGLTVYSKETAAPSFEFGLGAFERDGRDFALRFDGMRGERRTVELRRDGDDARVRVGFDLDYGHYPGAIDSEHSSLHFHGEQPCFDLAVTLIDGNQHLAERWVGHAER